MGWENKAQKKTALLLEPTPSDAGIVMRFECAGFHFGASTHGRGFLVNMLNDSMKSAETLKYTETTGVQKPLKWHVGEAGEETTYLESFGEPIPTEQAAVAFEAKVKKEEKLELNAVL